MSLPSVLSEPVMVKEDFYMAGGFPRMLQENVFVWKVRTKRLHNSAENTRKLIIINVKIAEYKRTW